MCVRSAYNYQAKGVVGLASLDMPRKARLLPRRKPGSSDKEEGADAPRERVDRAGRTWADFAELPLVDRVRVVRGDSVEGFRKNAADILSLHVVARSFQFYLKKRYADPAAVVAWLDVGRARLRLARGLRGGLGILLFDRGLVR